LPNPELPVIQGQHSTTFMAGHSSVPTMSSGLPFPITAPEGPASAPILSTAQGGPASLLNTLYTTPPTSMGTPSVNQHTQYLLQHAISQTQQSQRLPALGMYAPAGFAGVYQPSTALSQAQLQFHLQTQAALAQQRVLPQQATPGQRVSFRRVRPSLSSLHAMPKCSLTSTCSPARVPGQDTAYHGWCFHDERSR
jgi:hypothetical protein